MIQSLSFVSGYFSQHNVFKGHPCCNFLFFLKAGQYYIAFVGHILFIHSSVGYISVVSVFSSLVNNAAVNVYIFFHSYMATLNPVAFSMYWHVLLGQNMLLVWAVMGNLEVPRKTSFCPYLWARALWLPQGRSLSPTSAAPALFGSAQQDLWGLDNHYACIGT